MTGVCWCLFAHKLELKSVHAMFQLKVRTMCGIKCIFIPKLKVMYTLRALEICSKMG